MKAWRWLVELGSQFRYLFGELCRLFVAGHVTPGMMRAQLGREQLAERLWVLAGEDGAAAFALIESYQAEFGWSWDRAAAVVEFELMLGNEPRR